MNAEGAALFAVLAPVGRRRAATRLLVTFQVMYDYLDALTERPTVDPLRSSRQLHLALLAALGGPAPVDGYFAHHPLWTTAVTSPSWPRAAERSSRRLPGACEAAPHAIRAAIRSAEGQSQSHATAFTTEHDLIGWAERETPIGLDLLLVGDGRRSRVLPADPCPARQRRRTPNFTATCAARIAAAYWPWITGLNALLDDLIDTAEDAADGTHSYIALYTEPGLLSRRLGTPSPRRASGGSLSCRSPPARGDLRGDDELLPRRASGHARRHRASRPSGVR